MKKRMLAVLLALCLVLSMGAGALAAGEETSDPYAEMPVDDLIAAVNSDELTDEEWGAAVEQLIRLTYDPDQPMEDFIKATEAVDALASSGELTEKQWQAMDKAWQMVMDGADGGATATAAAAMEDISAEEQVIYDENSITITVTALSYDSGKAVLTLRVDNAIADRELSLSCPDAVVNGWMVYGVSVWDGNEYIPAGGSGEVTVSIPYNDLSDQMKAAVGAFSDIQLDISIAGYTALHDFSDILRYRALCPVQTSIPAGQTGGVWEPAEPVYDADGVVLAPAGEAQIMEMDGGVYTGALLYCENNTDLLLSASCAGGALDGAEQWMELMTADGGLTFAMGLHETPVPQLLQPGAKALLPLVCQDSEAFGAASELTASIGLLDVNGGQALPEAAIAIPLA